MSNFRVRHNGSGWIAEEPGIFWGWNPMFCGYSDLPREFVSPEEASKEVRALVMRERENNQKPIYSFYIANNGQICPTRDSA